MAKLYNVSSSPHVRSKLTTENVMFAVVLSLLPTTLIGVRVHGINALITILCAIAAAVLTEFIFDKITHKPNTIRDFSAVVTGLLLALCMPEGTSPVLPILGSVFAILVVKNLFGGLGKNFMNPALAGRCFLLISFGTAMTNYKLDAVSAATPLVDLANGARLDLASIILGTSNGVIGSSALGLLIGGLFLWCIGGITIEIPAAAIASFAIMIALFGGQGLDPLFILTHVCTGGILMGAFFMATDPVTSPVTSSGQIVFGIIVGVLSALFRIKGSAADSVSYAIIISNLMVPLIDEYIVPKPFGHRAQKEKTSGSKVPRSAVVLCAITLLAGLALSGIFAMTKDTIAEQKAAAAAESYKAVLPEADSFKSNEAMDAAIAELNGETYGTDFGKVTINEAYDAVDASGNVIGSVISVTSGDGFDGNVTVAVGILSDGTVSGIDFTELHETAGMGMRCGEDEWKGQFAGRNVPKFNLNKAGGSTAEDEIDSVSGASVTSGAVVNAVNAALDFFASNAN